MVQTNQNPTFPAENKSTILSLAYNNVTASVNRGCVWLSVGNVFLLNILLDILFRIWNRKGREDMHKIQYCAAQKLLCNSFASTCIPPRVYCKPSSSENADSNCGVTCERTPQRVS